MNFKDSKYLFREISASERRLYTFSILKQIYFLLVKLKV